MCYQIVSCAVMALGLALFGFAGAVRRKWPYFAVGFLFALTAGPIFYISDQGFSECYAILFVGVTVAAASWSIEAPNRALWSFIAGVSLLAACFCRTECVFLTIPVALLFLPSSGILLSLPPLLLPVAGLSLKYVISVLTLPPEGRFWYKGGTGEQYQYILAASTNVRSYLSMLLGSCKIYVGVSVVCALTWILIYRTGILRADPATSGKRDVTGVFPVKVSQLYGRYGLWLLCLVSFSSVYLKKIHDGTITHEWRYLTVPLLFFSIFASNCLSDMFGLTSSLRTRREFSSRFNLIRSVPFLLACAAGASLLRISYYRYTGVAGLSSDAAHVIKALNSKRLPGQPVVFDFAGWQEEQIASYVARPADFDCYSQSDNHNDFAHDEHCPFSFTDWRSALFVQNQIKRMLPRTDFFLVEAPGFAVSSINPADLLHNGCFQCIEKALLLAGSSSSSEPQQNLASAFRVVETDSTFSILESNPIRVGMFGGH